jgi:hypothetical protein
MSRPVWIIEGWQGHASIWSKVIPCSDLPASRVENVLRCLVAKHGLSEDEIVSAFARTNAARFTPHLEITKSQANEPWSLSCGGNPFFTARVGEQSDQTS